MAAGGDGRHIRRYVHLARKPSRPGYHRLLEAFAPEYTPVVYRAGVRCERRVVIEAASPGYFGAFSISIMRVSYLLKSHSYRNCKNVVLFKEADWFNKWPLQVSGCYGNALLLQRLLTVYYCMWLTLCLLITDAILIGSTSDHYRLQFFFFIIYR